MAKPDFNGTDTTPSATPGTAGLSTQVGGQAATVSAAALATGGVGSGNFIQTDIDTELFRFKGDDTPLLQLMLMAKKVKVTSPEVKHYMLDEARCTMETISSVGDGSAMQVTLPLSSRDQNLVRPYSTILVKGVNGYTPDGQSETPGKFLMLFVVDADTATNNPVVRAINGPKGSPEEEFCLVPEIPARTELVVLSNAMYETQKEVDPDLIVPQPRIVYLQKRGMNQIVSDYFDAQRKEIPFTKAIIAEQAINNFKTRSNRTLWAGRAGKFKVNVPKMGLQFVYTTEGVRWQFVKELQHSGKWTIEKLIALAKMFFTGEDAPKKGLLLAGKNLLEQLQCIDYSKHPEIQIVASTHPAGWDVTRIHTVFGDIDIKREPTLDRLGWSNSGALLGEDRLVHYTYSSEHSFSDRVDGEEATRSGILTWDALALKGSCHIWIDGEGEPTSDGATGYTLWDSPEAPAASILEEGGVFYLVEDCPAISDDARAGTMWQYSSGKWEEYMGAGMR